MKNCSKIFFAIKLYCKHADLKSGKDYFAIISEATDIPTHKLESYLHILQIFNLIKYSWHDKLIQLTEKGEKENLIILKHTISQEFILKI